MNKQNFNQHVAKSSHLDLKSKYVSSSSNSFSTVSKCFFQNDISLSNKDKEISQGQHSNKYLNKSFESPYKNVIADVKTFWKENTSLNDETDFKTSFSLKNKARIKRKFKTDKPMSSKRKKNKFCQKGNLLKHFNSVELNNEEIAKGFNPEHVQMATVMSKSVQIQEHDKDDILNENHCTRERVLTLRETLQEFGFKLNYHGNTSYTSRCFDVNSKDKRKGKFKYINPTLFLRTNEEREKLISERVVQILSEIKQNVGLHCENTRMQDIPICKQLQKLHCKESRLFKNVTLVHFYVNSLNISPDKQKCGSLLKSWNSIPGREKSPSPKIHYLRKSDNCNTLRSEEEEFYPNQNKHDAELNSSSLRYGAVSPELFCSENEESYLVTSPYKEKITNNLFSLKILKETSSLIKAESCYDKECCTNEISSEQQKINIHTTLTNSPRKELCLHLNKIKNNGSRSGSLTNMICKDHRDQFNQSDDSLYYRSQFNQSKNNSENEFIPSEDTIATNEWHSQEVQSDTKRSLLERNLDGLKPLNMAENVLKVLNDKESNIFTSIHQSTNGTENKSSSSCEYNNNKDTLDLMQVEQIKQKDFCNEELPRISTQRNFIRAYTFPMENNKRNNFKTESLTDIDNYKNVQSTDQNINKLNFMELSSPWDELNLIKFKYMDVTSKHNNFKLSNDKHEKDNQRDSFTTDLHIDNVVNLNSTFESKQKTGNHNSLTKSLEFFTNCKNVTETSQRNKTIQSYNILNLCSEKVRSNQFNCLSDSDSELLKEELKYSPGDEFITEKFDDTITDTAEFYTENCTTDFFQKDISTQNEIANTLNRNNEYNNSLSESPLKDEFLEENSYTITNKTKNNSIDMPQTKIPPLQKEYTNSSYANLFDNSDNEKQGSHLLNEELNSTINKAKCQPEEEEKIDNFQRKTPSRLPTLQDKNFNTPDNNFIIKTTNVTPSLNYTELSTPEIIKQLNKFGLKPLKRKRGLQLLRYIYETTHPPLNVNESSSIDISGELKVKNIRNSGVFKRLKMDENKLEKLTSEIEIVGNLILEKEDELIFEKKRSTKIASYMVPLHIAWHNLISSNICLKESILLYEPIELESVHLTLQEQGYHYNIEDMQTFFDRKCINTRRKQNHAKKSRW